MAGLPDKQHINFYEDIFIPNGFSVFAMFVECPNKLSDALTTFP